MKAAFALLVIVGLGIFLAWHFGMRGFDPAKQAEEFKVDVTTGTDVNTVLEKYPPKKWRIIGLNQGLPQPSTPVNFEREDFDDRVANNKLPNGYIFRYVFTDEHQYEVWFAPTGKVVYVEDALTVGDLLDPGGLLKRE